MPSFSGLPRFSFNIHQELSDDHLTIVKKNHQNKISKRQDAKEKTSIYSPALHPRVQHTGARACSESPLQVGGRRGLRGVEGRAGGGRVHGDCRGGWRAGGGGGEEAALGVVGGEADRGEAGRPHHLEGWCLA